MLLHDGRDDQIAAGRGFADHDVAAVADVQRAQRCHLGERQHDAGGRAQAQVGGADRFAGDAVGQAVGLGDGAVRRVQHDVVQHRAAARLHHVVDVDVVDRVQPDVAVDQQRIGRIAEVLDHDAAAVDFQVVAQHRLAADVHRADAHRTRIGGGVTAALVADDDLAEAVGKSLDLIDVDVERARGDAVGRRADLDRGIDRSRTQRHDTAADDGLAAPQEADLVGLDQQVATAVQYHAALEHHVLGAEDAQAAAIVQGHRLAEGHRAGGGDGDVAVDHHFAVEGDVVRVVDRAADIDAADQQAFQRVEHAQLPVQAHVAGREQRQRVGQQIAVAVQPVRGAGAQLDVAGAVGAGGDDAVAHDQHGIAEDGVVAGGDVGGKRGGVARAVDHQRGAAQQHDVAADVYLAAQRRCAQGQVVVQRHRHVGAGFADIDVVTAILAADDDFFEAVLQETQLGVVELHARSAGQPAVAAQGIAQHDGRGRIQRHERQHGTGAADRRTDGDVVAADGDVVAAGIHGTADGVRAGQAGRLGGAAATAGHGGIGGDFHVAQRQHDDVHAFAAGGGEFQRIDDDGAGAEQEALGARADLVAHDDGQVAAGALQQCAVGGAQHRAVGQVRRLQIARHIGRDHLAVGGIDGEHALAHQPVQFGVEIADAVGIGAVRHGQPAGDADVGTVHHFGRGIDQPAARHLDDDVAAAGDAHAGVVQRDVAVLGGQRDIAALRADVGTQRQVAAIPAGVKTDRTGASADAFPGGDDGPLERSDADHATGGLHDVFDDHRVDVLDRHIAAAVVGQVQTRHLGLDGVVRRADAAGGDDDQARRPGDDVGAALATVDHAAGHDVQVGGTGGAQLAQRDGTVGAQFQWAAAGIDDGLAGHGHGAAAGVEHDVAARAADVALFRQGHAGMGLHRDVAADTGDALVEVDRAGRGGQVHRVGTGGIDGTVDRQRAAGAHEHRGAVAAVDALDGDAVGLVDADRALGGDVQRIRLDGMRGITQRHRAGLRRQRHRARTLQTGDGDAAGLRSDRDVAGETGDAADGDVAIGHQRDVAAGGVDAVGQGDTADVQRAGLEHGQVAVAGHGHLHAADFGGDGQVLAGADLQRAGGHLAAQRDAAVGGQDHGAGAADVER